MTVSLLRFRFALTALALTPAFSGAEPVSLEPVTITGTRTASTAEELPTGTVILDQQDIERLPATNLADVLDSVAGLNVRRQYGTDGSRAGIDLLGFGATGNQNTLVLLNGHRYSNVDLTGPELGSIPVAAIERIEILPGAGAALYGNGAVGGVINIVTRQHYGNSASASLSNGTFKTVGGKAQGTYSKNGFNTAASVDALNTEGYRENNDLQQRNGFFDLRHTGDDTTVFMTTTAEEQSLGLPGGRGAFFGNQQGDYEENPEGADNNADWANQETWTVTPGTHLSLAESVELRLDGQFRNKQQDFYYENFGSLAYGDNRVITRSINPRLVLTPSLGPTRHTLNLGWDRYDYDYQARYAASPSQLENSSNTKDVDQTRESVFIHDVINVADDWSFTLGARTLDVETESEGLGLFAGSNQSDNEEQMYEGGVRYHVTDSFSAFAGAQRSARVFNADETNPSSTTEPEAQVGRTYTAGASWKQDKQHSTMTFWRGRYENEIIYDPATFSNRNLEDPTLRKGVSLNSRWQLEQDLFLSLNGSYQRATFQGGPNEGNEVPLVPLQTGHVQVDYDARDWLRFTVTHRYMGKRYLDEDFQNSRPRLDSYRMTDALVRASWPGGFLEFGAYNIGDELATDYGVLTPFAASDYSAYPLPGRHFLTTLGLEW